MDRFTASLRSGATQAGSLRSGATQAGPPMTRITLPVHVAFAINGLLFASWVSRIPAVRERLAASEPELGAALLFIAIGSLVTMPTTGWLCDRFGVRRVLRTAMLLCAGAFVAATLAPSIVVLGVALFAVGSVYGMWDVAMNAAAHEVELRAGRPLMPRFHGAFSLGGLAGAGLGALAAAAGLAVPAHLAVAAAITAALGFIATRHIAEPPRHVHEPRPDGAPAGPRRVPLRLVVIGLLVACTTLGEGAAADWGALFLHDERGVSESMAALGYAVFSCAMAIGRFGGTWVLARMSRVAALRRSGALLAAAVVVLVGVDVVPVALAAMAAWGLGVAIVFPAAMSAAAEQSTSPARGIAVVATIGYGGFLVGPPTIGLLAGQVGLGAALSVVAVLGVVAIALAPAAGPRPRPDQDERWYGARQGSLALEE